MVNVDEALVSEDPKIVKRLRGSISTQITCDINLLKKELSKRQDGKFELDKISHQLIKIQKKKLTSHFETIQKLHDRFILIREEGLSDEAEAELANEDAKYMENVTLQVCPILDDISLYEESLTDANKIKDLSKTNENVRESCLKAKGDFDVILSKVLQEITLIDGLENKSEIKSNAVRSFPTESLSRNLLTAFNEVKKMCNKLKEHEKSIGDSVSENKALITYDKEYKEYLDADMKLKTYELQKSHLCPTVDSVPDSHRAVPLKINKPDNLTFSGQARDFATFKRDFMAIIVPHRDQAQIGIYFKQRLDIKQRLEGLARNDGRD